MTLRGKLPMIGAKRLILTHMSPDMLRKVSELQDCEAAHDGLEVQVF
jgi:ribonuclease BN (tRNA processing enzyme)